MRSIKIYLTGGEIRLIPQYVEVNFKIGPFHEPTLEVSISKYICISANSFFLCLSSFLLYPNNQSFQNHFPTLQLTSALTTNTANHILSHIDTHTHTHTQANSNTWSNHIPSYLEAISDSVGFLQAP